MSSTLTELKKYSDTIKASSINKDTYWIRKSSKVVLAMLCICINNDFHWIPGINIEVCIAAGTICAERNAISSAFARFPDLIRKNIVNIAIAELDLDTRELKHIEPCCLCASWLKKIWGSAWIENVVQLLF